MDLIYARMDEARGLEALIATFEDSPHRTYGMRLASETIEALETDATAEECGGLDRKGDEFMERLKLAARKCIPELCRACYATMAVRALIARTEFQ